MQVYEFTTAGVHVGDFDVGGFGVIDPEAVEYNAANDTLYVLSSRLSAQIIVEVTKTGGLIQTIDFSAPDARNAAGLAYAPASNGSGARSSQDHGRRDRGDYRLPLHRRTR